MTKGETPERHSFFRGLLLSPFRNQHGVKVNGMQLLSDLIRNYGSRTTMANGNKSTYFNEDDSLVFTPSQIVPLGSPLRFEKRQGLWRYTARVGSYVEVVGPYFPTGTKVGNERQRIFKIEDAKWPGRQAKPIDVAPSAQVQAINAEAQRGRKR